MRVNGVDLDVLEAGDGPLVLLCHGFPELAYSWRHQVPALASAGYHVVAPDQRGYGASTRPAAIEDYDIAHLTGDLLGLMDAYGEERAVVVGHDWGAIVAWQLALRHPDRVRGVVGMSVPFLPRSERPPTEVFKFLFGDQFFYILYFQEPGVADAELGRDVATTMRRVLAGSLAQAAVSAGTGFVDRIPDPERLPDWITQPEIDVYVEAFTSSGFTGPLNWYRNLDRNWHLGADLAGAKIDVPALFVGGSADPVLLMTPPSVMDGWVTDLRGSVLVDGAGHWVQQERPDEVNAALVAFIGGLTP